MGASSAGRKMVLPGRGPVQTFKINSGPRVIYHKPLGLMGANCFIWFPIGSRFETKSNEGVAHLVEHLVFQKNSPRIKNCIDKIESLGGELNACTTKEYVCFELTALSSDLQSMLDKFLEMIFKPDVDTWNVIRELKVIAEELREDLSDPETLLGEKVFAKAFSYPLGHGIGGSLTSIKKLNHKKAVSFHDKYFNPGQAVICLVSAGSLSPYKKLMTKFFAGLPGKRAVSPIKLKKAAGKIKPFSLRMKKDVQGCFLSYFLPGPSLDGKYRLELALLDQIICGGMGSYFFEELRIKRGIIYSTSSHLHSFTDNGLYEIEFFCSPAQKKTAEKIFQQLWRDLLEHRVVTEQKLEEAKTQVLSAWSLGLDDLEIRNSYLARGLLFRGKIKYFDELCKDVQKINLYDIKNLLNWWKGSSISKGQILPNKIRS